MGLFDSIVGAVGGALGQGDTEGKGAQAIIGNLLRQGVSGQSGTLVGQLLSGLGGGAAPGGGLQSVLETLAANGLGDEVSSWLGNTANLPVSPDQIRAALGSEQVRQLAAATGLPVGDFLKHLADHLPAAASEASGAPTS